MVSGDYPLSIPVGAQAPSLDSLPDPFRHSAGRDARCARVMHGEAAKRISHAEGGTYPLEQCETVIRALSQV